MNQLPKYSLIAAMDYNQIIGNQNTNYINLYDSYLCNVEKNILMKKLMNLI